MRRDAVTDALDQQVNLKRIEEVDDCLTPTDQLLASIAVSLKRIADGMAGAPEEIRLAIYNGIIDGIYAARPK